MNSVSSNPRSAAEAQRQSQVDSSLVMLDQSLTGAEQCLDELLVRLSSVLMPDSPQKDGNTNVPRPVKVTVANSIDVAADRVAAIAGRLANLMSRLEN